MNVADYSQTVLAKHLRRRYFSGQALTFALSSVFRGIQANMPRPP
jgi:hypothetical protein